MSIKDFLVYAWKNQITIPDEFMKQLQEALSKYNNYLY